MNWKEHRVPFAAGFVIGALVVWVAALVSQRYVVLWPVAVDLTRTLAWPVATILVLFALRKSIGSFFTAIGARATKVGAFDISIELGAAEVRRWSGPSLDTFRGQDAALTQDSSGSLYRAIAETTPADYAVVDIGSGESWLTSRLFVVASIIPRVRGLKRIVFVEGDDERFLGVATVDAVRCRIAEKWTWLEEAYLRAHLQSSPPKHQIAFKSYLKVSSVNGPLRPNDAESIVRDFLSAIQVRPALPLPPDAELEYVTFADYSEHASWLDSASLRALLGRELHVSSIARNPAVDSETAAKTLLRHDEQFVPITDAQGRFVRLVDRCEAMTQTLRTDL